MKSTDISNIKRKGQFLNLFLLTVYFYSKENRDNSISCFYSREGYFHILLSLTPLISLSLPASNFMFNVNSRNTCTRYEICSKLTITTPLASFRYLCRLLWTYFTPCSLVSIVNFEQVYAGWAISVTFTTALYLQPNEYNLANSQTLKTLPKRFLS